MLLCVIWLLVARWVAAQEPVRNPLTEQQLENLTELNEEATEDDGYWQQLESLRRHPLDLNRASREDLEGLPMLSALQIDAFFSYRKLLGKLSGLQELQAIPGWDLVTIRLLLPFVTAGDGKADPNSWSRRLYMGNHSLLLRASKVLEQATGYQAPATPDKDHYQGDPYRLFARYRYSYGNVLQYGVTADKDAGEPFFTAPRRAGFDFYSFHFFIRGKGTVKALALGDFSVNMGQGLIHWQSLAFKKSAAVVQIKRQGPVLKPYSAAGEYLFHRGGGITLQHRHWEATAFVSHRQLDANLYNDSVTSLLTMGYHRTEAELAERYNLNRLTAGARVAYRRDRWQVGVNSLQYRFSRPFVRSGEPYDLFAMTGERWSNYSADYSLTVNNLHLFGEAAVDHRMNKAIVQGLMMSLDSRIDLSLLYRNIAKGYQALQGNAFTESYLPGNEEGIFTGLTVRPVAGWQLDAYADLFRFPWLRYRINAPGHGSDYLLQVTHKPNKQVELVSRFRVEQKPANSTVVEGPLKPVLTGARQNWRTQFSYQVSTAVLLRSRFELVWFRSSAEAAREKGFSAFTEVFYSSPASFTANARLHFFETDSYDARVYAYEQDVPYYFSIPVFNGKGWRYYINVRRSLSGLINRRRSGKLDCTLAVRFASFVFPATTTTGSGLDEMTGKQKREVRIQLLLTSR